MKKIQEAILKVVRYFSLFNYAPTEDEIHAYLRLKISKKSLQSELKKMIRGGLVTKKTLKMPILRTPVSHLWSNSWYNSPDRYTLLEYSERIKNYDLRVKSSFGKIEKIDRYAKLISKFSQIKLVGLSGSVSMLNAGYGEDIDLFIISSKNRLWTARFLSIVIGYMLRVTRRYGESEVKDKVCLNMFFDEKALKMPKFKQNEYIAHEVLQMKPLIDKNYTYKRFIEANVWVFNIFPNANNSLKFKIQSSKLQFKIQNYLKNFKLLIVIFHFSLFTFHLVGDLTESILKHLQLILINRHKTTEIISDRQLWFFPDDFEKKVTPFK